jgi:multidrug efflux pump subunit AcrA (membrane-fusion protein)
MVDIAILGTALGSIKTATDIAKLIKDSGTSLEQAEVKLQIAELISSLADIKMELADVQTILVEKDQNILELEKQLNTKKSVVWSKPYYFVENGEEKDGPYCQQCYDTDNKLIRLQGGGTKFWNCLTCKSHFKDANFVREPLPNVNRSRF